VEVFSIINPPESAILAVGSIIDKPVVIDNKVCIRPLMNLTLSIDHRVLDGAVGSGFLQTVKLLTESPPDDMFII
jgi:pyruvate dehydrogenase E2 component (dihydrolipoamide acetyltransferase)